jgi:undecaprenyl phosphate N,N'-diacetylbacillosamine 1-phosphate transferase
MYLNFIKPSIDKLIAIIGLIFTFPIFISIAIINTISFRGNPFFTQPRPGKNEKKIFIIKFKSMNDKKDKDGNLLPDINRITPIGKFIRQTSIDELPQLINVLLGDMSIVGPRPLLFKYLPLYNQQQKQRHLVRPGITGWAQVNGRNSISWTDKFSLDFYYVQNVSIWLDLKIIWMTFLKVVKKEGVNQTAERPMNPFNGNN